jgi:hypothetical protein
MMSLFSHFSNQADDARVRQRRAFGLLAHLDTRAKPGKAAGRCGSAISSTFGFLSAMISSDFCLRRLGGVVNGERATAPERILCSDSCLPVSAFSARRASLRAVGAARHAKGSASRALRRSERATVPAFSVLKRARRSQQNSGSHDNSMPHGLDPGIGCVLMSPIYYIFW